MELLISASFIASFFTGVAALFAPCCITVLLPTYFASIFKEKSTLYLMTFIYFLGLLTVFLPLGLGVVFLSRIFSQYHNTIFLLGGIFLIFLGMTLLLGKQFSLPQKIHPSLKKNNFASVFVLGIFSGVATTCCAPVLAGVLALSALPGSFILGSLYTLAFVLGMVIPLFTIAAFLDKVEFTNKFFAYRKTVSFSIFNLKIKQTFANIFSGFIFVFLGLIILFLARTNGLTSHSSYQLSINIYLTKIIRSIGSFTSLIPEFVWGILFVAVFLLIIYSAVRELLFLTKIKNRR